MATETEKEAKPTPKPIASGLAFSGICNVRNTEAHLRWLGAQVSFFLNLPAFAGAVFRLVAKLEVPELVAIAIGGFLLVGANEFLRQFIKRDNKLMDLWNDKLDELERVNGIEGGVQVFSSRRYRRLRTSRTRLQRRLEDAMFVCIVGWGAIALWAVAKLIRTLFFAS
ncbi:MAG: hypothetical protein WAZ27_04615 [Minisyncoccia bacterium]